MTQPLLMIEDDARLASMVGEYLRQAGFDVEHALDGASGLVAVQKSAAAFARWVVRWAKRRF
jgi:DNA-binding response OmpR family regulator